jgi:hypothetical protein
VFSFSVWLMLLYVHLTSAWTVQTRKITLYLCSVVKPHIPTKWSNKTKLFILKPLEKFNSLELWQLTLTKTNPFVIFSFVQQRRTIRIILENIINLGIYFLLESDTNDIWYPKCFQSNAVQFHNQTIIFILTKIGWK